MPAALRASVLIPTYEDWDRLQICLAALEKQSLAREEYEIIVINNERVQQAAYEKRSGIIYIHHPEGGSYAARNAGIAVAKSEVLAFTDADCIPREDWLENGLRLLADDRCDLVGGEIEMFRINTSIVSDYDFMFGLRQQPAVERYGYSVTANLFARKVLFDQIGLFDARRRSGGDGEWTRKAVSRGYKLVYGPEVVVRHPARHNLDALFKKNRRIVSGTYVTLRKRYAKKSILLWLRIFGAFRPHPEDWWRVLNGTVGRAGLSFGRRVGVCGLRIAIQYRTACLMLMEHLRQLSDTASAEQHRGE